MPDAECPHQSAWNKKKWLLQVSVRARLVYSLQEPRACVDVTRVSAGKCVFAIKESKHRLSNWDLSIFPPFFSPFVLFLDQLCRAERQVRLLCFSLAAIIRTESAMKVSPINHYSNQVALTFSSHTCRTSHTYIRSKGTARAQETLTGKKYIWRQMALRLKEE